jgi:hypothetical protein
MSSAQNPLSMQDRDDDAVKVASEQYLLLFFSRLFLVAIFLFFRSNPCQGKSFFALRRISRGGLKGGHPPPLKES